MTMVELLETQRRSDTGIQRHRDAEAQKYNETETQRCRDTGIQGYRDADR